MKDAVFLIDEFIGYANVQIYEEPGFEPNYCKYSELRVLAKLIRGQGAQRVLEIGTQAGMTAYFLAMNLGPTGVLYTIDIAAHMPAAADLASEQIGEVLSESNIGWYYRKRRMSNVRQLVGDSRNFDYRGAGAGDIHLCFVDANHEPDAVYQDVINVLPAMSQGACVVWHDFNGIESPDVGVKAGLSRLIRDGVIAAPIMCVRDTHIAYCRLR